MRCADALVAALALLEHPHVTKLAPLSRLPKGVIFLLEIAAGEAAALREACRLTGRPEAVLQQAAGFFIEQVLFRPGSDSYRTLGGDRETPSGELRRHMALIMRWLHPDLASNGAAGSVLNRSLYANRITQAWDRIKTLERRAAYNRFLAAQENKSSLHEHVSRSPASGSGLSERGANRDSVRQLVIYWPEPEDFWSRLLRFFRGLR
jgi:hypothetical protein